MSKTKDPNEDVVDENNLNLESVQSLPEEVVPDVKTDSAEPVDDSTVIKTRQPNKLHNLWHLIRTKKKLSIPLAIAVLLLILAAIPISRYKLLGLVMKKDVFLYTIDDKSKSSVYNTNVSIDGKQPGCPSHISPYPNCISKIPVGVHTIKVSKANYRDVETKMTIGIGKSKDKNIEIPMTATGRTVGVRISNKINGKAIKGVHIKIDNSESDTNENGDGSVVVDPTAKKVKVEISKEGFNNLNTSIEVSDSGNNFNQLSISPSGKIYFLSKLTGKIDVVKTDLDGTNRQIVLAGTGKEEDTNTIMLASRDWKFLALLSRRDSSNPRLYLIDTSNDKLTEMDSGDATFSLVGWQEHFFAYTVDRNNILNWQSKKNALKTFNADTLQLATIDETTADGTGENDYISENIESIYIQKGNLIYVKRWLASYYSVYRLAGKRMGIYSAKTNGSGKQLLKDFDTGNNGYISAILSQPDEIYYSVNNSTTSFYEFKDDKITESKDLTAESFNKFYPTYLISPSGVSAFWYEPRDGKNTLFTGSQSGSNGKQIASLSELVPYGWYSDEYLLVSKNSSELYILPANSEMDSTKLVKISDYHKPAASFLGYGGGYGGQ